MIQLIKVSNFQSHKNTVLDLHPGVNTIVGSSDVGKTALIRALRWLVWNRPQGDTMRSTWGGDTSVVVKINKDQITRTKNNKENSYLLNSSEFHAIKADVPAEISNALNLNEISVQRQFDRPFLLDSSPGDVAAHFNRVAHLDVIDTATKNVQSWLRQTERQIEFDEQRLNECKNSLNQYCGLEELDQNLSELEKDERKRNDATRNCTALLNTIQEIGKTIKASDGLEKTIKLDKPVNELLTWINQKNELSVKMNSLQHLIRVIDGSERDLSLKTTEATSLEDEFRKGFPDVCPLCGQRREK